MRSSYRLTAADASPYNPAREQEPHRMAERLGALWRYTNHRMGWQAKWPVLLHGIF